MLKLRLLIITLFVTNLSLVGWVQAASVTWTVENAVLQYGFGTVTGTFDYDADLKQYSNVDLWWGTEHFSVSKVEDVGLGKDDYLFSAYSDGGERYNVFFWFDEVLTNAGGVVDFHTPRPGSWPGQWGGLTDLGGEFLVGYDYDEFGNLVPQYSQGVAFTSGYVVGVPSSTPVPLPAAVWFFGSALVGLGCLRRKQAT